MTSKFFAVAERIVLSSWNTSITSELCHLDKITDELIGVQSHPGHYSCILQVEAPHDSLTSIGLPEDRISGNGLVYVERKGNYEECPDRYVLIDGHDKGCIALFQNNHLELTLSVLLSEVQSSGAFHCPELVKNLEIAKRYNHSCANVKSYNSIVTCGSQYEYYYYYYYDDGTCNLDFMSKCIKFLGKNDVVFQCYNANLGQNETILLVYPPGITKLVLSNKNIAEIHNDVFQQVPELQELNLYGNQLSVVPRYVFRGLNHLTLLNLGANSLRIYRWVYLVVWKL